MVTVADCGSGLWHASLMEMWKGASRWSHPLTQRGAHSHSGWFVPARQSGTKPDCVNISLAKSKWVDWSSRTKQTSGPIESQRAAICKCFRT
jgi:hypothetical protein